MIILLNMGRILMVAWIIYSLLLAFVPTLLHRPPDRVSAVIQFACAYAIGYLLDRALSMVKRHRAVATAEP